MKKFLGLAILIVFVMVLALVAFSQEQYNFTMIIYGTSGNPFWIKVVNGTREAASLFGINVDVQFAEDDPVRQNNLIETAIANKVDGLGLCINIDDAYDENVKRAMDAGIPVVAYNVDDSQGAAGNARMAFVGQNFEVAGYAIAKRAIEVAGLKKGDHVVCPVEHPTAVYAAGRYAGVKKALDEVGCTSEVLDTGAISLEDTLTKLTQYLLGHKETKAVIALGQMPTEVAPQAIAEAGLDIPNAGFDISKTIVENILAGKTIATVDQQPFYQGFFTIAQLYYYRKYGLVPCDINTGAAIIDKMNAKPILDFADTVR